MTASSIARFPGAINQTVEAWSIRVCPTSPAAGRAISSVADLLNELVQRLDARDRSVDLHLHGRQALGVVVRRMVVPRLAQRLSCPQQRDELTIGVVQLAQGPDEKLSRRDRLSPARG